MDTNRIHKILIVGSGIMGHGIAQVCAQAGYETIITETVPETQGSHVRERLINEGIEHIKSNLREFEQKKLLSSLDVEKTLSRIQSKTDIKEATKDADFVIEAVVENMGVKKDLFREISALVPEHAVLASNTSSFKITEIGKATDCPERVVGMHWWNPPYLMPLVEIIRGERTSEKSISHSKSLVESLNRVPVICKDTPGFIGVRLQAALVTEAITMLQDGVASAEDIDTAVKMTLGLRLPITGPLKIVDLGGADTFYYAYNYLYNKLGDRFKPPRLLEEKIRAGDLGIKTGKGFYEYNSDSIRLLVKNRDDWLIERLRNSTKV